MNRAKFSRPCSHFGITIFWHEEEKRGIPLYQTWHIVNSITLYHLTSHSILSYHMVSHPSPVAGSPFLGGGGTPEKFSKSEVFIVKKVKICSSRQ